MTSTRRSSKEESVDILEREVGVLVRRVRSVMAERARSIHADLSTPGYLILSYLDDKGGQRSSELAECFGIDKGAISRQVNHLSELGLITRTPDPEDGRAQHLEVTDEGHARLHDTSRMRRKLLDERLAEWSDADLRGFVDSLTRYNASLDSIA